MKKKSPASPGSRKPGLTRALYDDLRDDITTGKLRPGENLSRRKIASRYGVSYIPVLEALVRLENAGLVEAGTKQMARVRSITEDTIRSDYVLREAVETQAIRLACGSATDTEIEDLDQMAEAVDVQAPKDPAQPRGRHPVGLLLHWGFHKQIAELSRYSVLVRELERIELLGRLQANWYYLPELLDPPRWHSLLVDAIRERNPEKADALMRTHVQSGLQKELKAFGVWKRLSGAATTPF